MSYSYRNDYYETASPNILENEHLRLPQIQSYVKTRFHFESGKKTHAVIVIPTGVGKTGIMALLPYGVSKGRVLIIAPYSPIRNSITRALDPYQPENFYLKRNIFSHIRDLPNTIVYNGNNTPDEVLENSNLVIVNIHKLQDRLISSMTNRLSEDFFDMIIIDEAHHSTARTWVNTVQHFSQTKVVKVTATPYRTDYKEIAGELIYKYSLGQAMAANYVKSLQRFDYIPNKLILTMDNLDKQYTLNEIFDMGLKDEDWVSRSVAFSEDCSRSVVKQSIAALKEKKQYHDLPHKIIAIASNIDHAIMISNIYEEEGLKVALIHSGLEAKEQDSIFSDIRNHRVDVVVHVSMLGEGYDHCYLSIAAIFRAFRNPLPYSQFIGRILRTIPEEDNPIPSDNVGIVIAHENLYLNELWEYYRREMQESEIIKHLQEEDEIISFEPSTEESADRVIDIGQVYEEGAGTIKKTSYLSTEMIRAQEGYQEAMDTKIQAIMDAIGVDQERARSIIIENESDDTFAKRPDLFYQYTRKEIDVTIREEIVPRVLSTLDIDFKARTIADCNLFNGNFNWIRKQGAGNDAMLAMNYNYYLKLELGKNRNEWTVDDCKIALKLLPQRTEIVMEVLRIFIEEQ